MNVPSIDNYAKQSLYRKPHSTSIIIIHYNIIVPLSDKITYRLLSTHHTKADKLCIKYFYYMTCTSINIQLLIHTSLFIKISSSASPCQATQSLSDHHSRVGIIMIMLCILIMWHAKFLQSIISNITSTVKAFLHPHN